MKNLNSFKSVFRAIEFEIDRQADVLDAGEKVIQETRKWDDVKGKNMAMRSKEEAQDYRYFPDPDILPIKISDEEIQKIKEDMPRLPEQRRKEYVEKFGLPEYNAQILTSSKYVSDYFEECVRLYNLPQKISNWIMVDLLKLVKEQEEFVFPISEQHLVEIIKMVEDKLINKTVGLQLIDKVIETNQSPKALADKMGLLVTISDQQIIDLLKKLKAENAKVCADFKQDPQKVMGFIVGFVMKNTGGKANSDLVRKLIPEIFND